MQAMLDARHRDPSRHHVRASRSGYAGSGHASLPHSEDAQDHCIMLPLYPQMTEQEQDTVVRELKSAVLAQMGAVPAK